MWQILKVRTVAHELGFLGFQPDFSLMKDALLIEPDCCLPVFIAVADVLSSSWWKTGSTSYLGALKKKKWIEAFCRFTKPLALLLAPVSGASLWCGTLILSKMLGGKRQIVQGLGPPPPPPFPPMYFGSLYNCSLFRSSLGCCCPCFPEAAQCLWYSCCLLITSSFEVRDWALFSLPFSAVLVWNFAEQFCQNNFLMCFYCRCAHFAGVW